MDVCPSSIRGQRANSQAYRHRENEVHKLEFLGEIFDKRLTSTVVKAITTVISVALVFEMQDLAFSFCQAQSSRYFRVHAPKLIIIVFKATMYSCSVAEKGVSIDEFAEASTQ